MSQAPILSKTVKQDSMPHSTAENGQGGFSGFGGREGLGSYVYHHLQIEPVGRAPLRDKEAQGTPERVVRTELMKPSGADSLRRIVSDFMGETSGRRESHPVVAARREKEVRDISAGQLKSLQNQASLVAQC